MGLRNLGKLLRDNLEDALGTRGSDVRKGERDVFYCSTTGRLFNMIKSNRLDLAKSLCGASDLQINLRNSFEPRSVLEIAVTNNKVELAKIFLERGADPDDLDSKHNRSLLETAIESNNAEMAELLVRAGANVNVKSKWDQTPLIRAASIGNLEIVRTLVEAGADLLAKDKMPLFEPRTVLEIAITEGHTEVVAYLLAIGADANAQDSDGNTPLIIAVSHGRGNPAIVQLLMEHGADIHARRKKTLLSYDDTALLRAVRSGYSEVVDCLLDAGADPNDRTDEGITALMFGVKNGNLDIVCSLLQKGANPRMMDRKRKVALDYSNKNNREQMKRLLYIKQP